MEEGGHYRLTGLDASFLAMETRRAQMHTLKVAIVDPPVTAADDPVAWARQAIVERLHAVPALRQRPLPVPGRLHRPLLVDDPAFEPARHIRHARVPAPGDRAARDRTISEVCGGRLARDRPLWELWILDGLEGGQVALVLKLHHAIADGRVALNQLRALSAAEPRPLPSPRPAPAPADGARAALRERAADLRATPALVRRTKRSAAEVKALKAALAPDEVLGAMPAGPRTRFSQPMSDARSWATASLPFDEIRAVCRASGATVNEVLVCLSAEALRGILAEDGVPLMGLAAGIPVTTCPEDELDALVGNRWSFVSQPLFCEEADPAARLALIQAASARQKAVHEIEGDLLEHWWQRAPLPLVSGVMRLMSRADAFKKTGLANMVVSNVRGATEPLPLGDGTITDFFSVGPLAEGCACNITAWSYAGRLNVAVVSSANALPDPAAFLAPMRSALGGLLQTPIANAVETT